MLLLASLHGLRSEKRKAEQSNQCTNCTNGIVSLPSATKTEKFLVESEEGASFENLLCSDGKPHRVKLIGRSKETRRTTTADKTRERKFKARYSKI